MSSVIILLLFFFTTFSWHFFVPQIVRSRFMPWAIALALFNTCCSTFYVGLLHGVLGLINYILFAIMADGFAGGGKVRNYVWTAFLLFWSYMVVSSVWGYYVFDAVLYWLNVFVTTFCCGYYVGAWVLRTEGGVRKMVTCVSILSILIMVTYVRYGAVAAVEAGSVGRAGFDEEMLGEDVRTNVNYTALCMLSVIPFLVVAYLREAKRKSERFVKFIAAGCLLLAGLVLIRTGARNGAVGLLPSVWYFFFSTTNRAKKRKRIVLFVVTTLAMLIGVAVVMRGANTLRAFDLEGKTQTYYNSNLDTISSGRVSMWQKNLDMMTAAEKFHGRGIPRMGKQPGARKITAGNAHCMYITVFYNSGCIGILLFVIMTVLCVKRSFCCGERGRMGLLFFGTWFLAGIGEGWGMTGGAIGILGGLGIGLIGSGSIRNSEFMTNRLPYGR